MILKHSIINFGMAVPEFLMTDKKESFRTRRFRWKVNLHPVIWVTGGKVVFWSSDSSEVHLRLGLNLLTRNYVGSIFGGSFFSAADPFYMLMLMKQMGRDYVVWDKAASIRFKRPARCTLYAVLRIPYDELDFVRQEVKSKGHVTRTYSIQWLGDDGQVYAEIERQCYIADKSSYEKRKGETQNSRF